MTLSSLKEKSLAVLKWSEQYTKTDMVYLAKGGFWLGLGKIMSLIISFALSIVFAKYWSPTEYGTYKYILSWIGILGIFSLSGMDAAVQQSVARGFEGAFTKGFKTKLKWGVLSSLAACGLSGYYLLHQNYRLAIPILISAAILPIFNASGIYNSFLNGKKIFNYQIKYSSLSQFIYSLTLVVVLLATKNLFWMIAAYLISRTVLNTFFYWRTKNKFQTNNSENSETIVYGKNLTIMNIIATIAGQIDQILLFTVIGPTQLAIYSFALVGPEKIKEILKLINTLAFPKFSAKEKELLKPAIMPKFWLLMILTLVIIIVYIILAPFLYKLFFPQYMASVPYTRFLSLIIFGFPVSFLFTYFQAKIMTKYLYIIKIVQPIVQILLMIVLVKFYGVWGIMSAMIISTFFSLILHLILVKKS
jgi:O-antigen/teichoic acid export membrane protein